MIDWIKITIERSFLYTFSDTDKKKLQTAGV